MPDTKIYDDPSDVDAEKGVVRLKGPGTIDVRFTPDAADETSDRLTTGALKARGQRYFSKARGRELGLTAGCRYPVASEGDEPETVRVEGGVSGPRPITFRCLHYGLRAAMLFESLFKAPLSRKRDGRNPSARSQYGRRKLSRNAEQDPRFTCSRPHYAPSRVLPCD